MVSVNHLTRTFGTFTAVDDITFEVATGEVFGFLGANGAGKTTAMKMISGLLKPTSGTATVSGYDVTREPEMVKRSIGYMSQRFSLYEDLTVLENIAFFGGIYGMSRSRVRTAATDVLDRLGMVQHGNTLVRSIPLGWKQKLAFSAAMLHTPKVVFLDEPTGGVDPITRRQFWDMIYQAAQTGVTMFVTTHYMDEAEYCDRVSIMVNGKIEALGSPSELRQAYSLPSMDEVFTLLARPS